MPEPKPKRAEHNAGAFVGWPIPVPMRTLSDDYRDELTEPEDTELEPAPESRSLVHRIVDRRWLLGSLAITVVVLAAALVASGLSIGGPRVDRSMAAQLATDAFISGEAPATLSDVTIDSVDLIFDGTRQAWEVSISGDVTEVGQTTVAYRSHQVLHVFDDNGEVTVVATD